jgi:hypothetical protein
MKGKKRKPPLCVSYTYAINKNAAFRLNGIAAFFYSTRFYVLAFAFTNNPNLFTQQSDKPCGIVPRCRSPPLQSVFGVPKKLIGEKKNV